jgi:hypothetical protein
MKEFFDKFIELERKISNIKGDFTLFALFLREDSIDKWDLIIAAPWIETDQKKALSYIAEQIQLLFKSKEITQLSRVVIINHSNPELDKIIDAVKIRHGCFEIQNNNFFGMQIKRAFIITSHKLNVSVNV